MFCNYKLPEEKKILLTCQSPAETGIGDEPERDLYPNLINKARYYKGVHNSVIHRPELTLRHKHFTNSFYSNSSRVTWQRSEHWIWTYATLNAVKFKTNLASYVPAVWQHSSKITVLWSRSKRKRKLNYFNQA